MLEKLRKICQCIEVKWLKAVNVYKLKHLLPIVYWLLSVNDGG